MLPFETLTGFLAVSILLTLAPGPDNLMVLGRSLARGPQAGLGIAIGCALGCFTHTLWAALGVSAAIASSPALFQALKLAGAAYLAWIGVQTLRHAAPTTPRAVADSPARPWVHELRRGFIANALNPKVALFFLALLPQFVHPETGSSSAQMVQLGIVFAVQTTLIFGAIALMAGRVGQLLARHPATGLWLDRGAGLIFIALALRLAFDSPSST